MDDFASRPLLVDEALFLALVAALPVMQPTVLQVVPYPIPAADLIFLAAAAAFAVAWLKGTRRLRLGAWPLAVSAYWLASALSAMLSADPSVSVVKLAGTTYLCGLGILTFQYVASPRELRRALTAWLVGVVITVAAAAAGLALYWMGVSGTANPLLYSFGSLPPGPYPRVMALFLNANTLCTYAAASITISLAAGCVGIVPRRVGLGLAGGSMATAMLTVSPVLGGVALVVSLWMAHALRARHPLLGTSAVAAGVMMAVAFFAATLVSPAGSGEASSRVMAWSDAWETFLGDPVFGRGLGLEVAQVHYLNASGGLEHLTDAHNMWLSVLAQQGTVGLVSFLAVVAFALLGALFGGHEADRPVRRGLYLAMISGVAYAGLSGSFEDTRHVWVLMGLAAARAGRG